MQQQTYRKLLNGCLDASASVDGLPDRRTICMRLRDDQLLVSIHTKSLHSLKCTHIHVHTYPQRERESVCVHPVRHDAHPHTEKPFLAAWLSVCLSCYPFTALPPPARHTMPPSTIVTAVHAMHPMLMGKRQNGKARDYIMVHLLVLGDTSKLDNQFLSWCHTIVPSSSPSILITVAYILSRGADSVA